VRDRAFGVEARATRGLAIAATERDVSRTTLPGVLSRARNGHGNPNPAVRDVDVALLFSGMLFRTVRDSINRAGYARHPAGNVGASWI
jgi:hypothetical protein